MTLRNSHPSWVWSDEVEEAVCRVFRGIIDIPPGRRCATVKWAVYRTCAVLGGKADLNQVAAAVAAHMPR